MTRAGDDVSRLAQGPTEHARKVLDEMPPGDRYEPRAGFHAVALDAIRTGDKRG